jgi:carbonic anhydrase
MTSKCGSYNACSSGSMPVNVTTTNKTCSTNCQYTFDYGLSSLNVTNNGDYLDLSYDGKTDVTYNGDKFTIQDIRLYKQSLNKYNGYYSDAELIIHHINQDGKNVLVCIPIKSNDAKSESEIMFSNIIKHSPSDKGDKASINISNYTMNNFIPKSSYYVYNGGSLPYLPCTGSYDILLFGIESAINMTYADMKILDSIICGQENKDVKTVDEDNYFYNETGTKNVINDEIYISCNEVDDKGNILQDGVKSPLDLEKLNSSTNLTDKDKEKYMKYVEAAGGIIGGIAAAYGIYKVLEWVKNQTTE